MSPASHNTQSETELLDPQKIDSLLAFAPDLVPTILQAYIDSLRGHLLSTREPLPLTQLLHVAHSIKGTSSECGATAAQALGARIEKACLEKDHARALHIAQSLEPTLRSTIRTVETRLASL